jgi:hypothetical protein
MGSTWSMTPASFPLLLLKVFGFKIMEVSEERIIYTTMTENKETSNTKKYYTKHGLRTKQTVPN